MPDALRAAEAEARNEVLNLMSGDPLTTENQQIAILRAFESVIEERVRATEAARYRGLHKLRALHTPECHNWLNPSFCACGATERFLAALTENLAPAARYRDEAEALRRQVAGYEVALRAIALNTEGLTKGWPREEWIKAAPEARAALAVIAEPHDVNSTVG